jgi:hypothetical protein
LDSHGFYFIERPPTGLFFGTKPGPVRLLLTHPPFGLPPWAWFALSCGLVALAGLGVEWWRRRRLRRTTK